MPTESLDMPPKRPPRETDVVTPSKPQENLREPDGNTLTVSTSDSFEIAPAEQAVLIGVSGGGKTSLLNVISGISVPDSGRVGSMAWR